MSLLLPAHSHSVNTFFLPLCFSLQTLAPLKRSLHYSDRICDSQQLGIPWKQRKHLGEEEKKIRVIAKPKNGGKINL